MSHRPPTVEQQRAILAEKGAKYRMMAWEQEFDAEMLRAEGENTDQLLANAEKLYRRANACDERLAKLPQPKDAE